MAKLGRVQLDIDKHELCITLGTGFITDIKLSIVKISFYFDAQL